MKNTRRKITQIRAIILFFKITVMLIGLFSTAVIIINAVDWSSDFQLTTHIYYDRNPSVMQTQNGTFWVVWASDRRLMQYDLFYKTSKNNGLNWTDPIPLTTYISVDQNPSIMQTQNGSIWILWYSKRTGNNEIFYMTSPDHGLNWTDPIQLTNSSYSDTSPSASQNLDGTICVVWQRCIGVNYDIFYKTSTDHGLSWSNATQLTTDPSTDMAASVTHTWNGTLWVVWSSHRTGTYDLYYKTSPDNGLNWTDPTPLVPSNKYDIMPSVMQGPDGAIWVVWAHQQGPQYDLYYTTSPDYGLSWTPETKIPLDDSGDDSSPSVIGTNDRKVCIVWESVRTDNYDIFYKIANITIHDVAITNVTPSTTMVYQGDEVSIQVVAENQGTENETIEVTCYVDSTSVGTQTIDLANGTATTLTFSWDTLNYPCGSYTISANASTVPDETVPNMDDNSFVDGTVSVDIPDLNEDGIVDILDFYIVAVAFGTMPGMKNWDPRADVAEPFGLIDGRDIVVIFDHFGQTS